MTSVQATSLKLLECPVCYNIYKTKIFMCEKGHNICEDCLPQVEQCPTCRCDFTGTRNYLVEELLSKSLQYTCENLEHGCTAKYSLQKMHAHQQLCHHRATICFVPQCDWNGRHSELKHHILNNHDISVFQGHGREILLCDITFSEENSNYNDLLFIQFKDKLFAYFYKRETNKILFSVTYIGLEEEARNFHFKLAFHNEDRSKKMQLQCNISTGNKMFSDKCLSMDYHTCKQFVRYNGKLQYFLKLEERSISNEVFEEQ